MISHFSCYHGVTSEARRAYADGSYCQLAGFDEIYCHVFTSPNTYEIADIQRFVVEAGYLWSTVCFRIVVKLIAMFKASLLLLGVFLLSNALVCHSVFQS